MKKNKDIFIFCVIGFIFVSVLGSLSHFFFEWSGGNRVIGFFFPVNESTWEHLKLAIFPTLLYFSFGWIYIKRANYIFALFITLILPIILIPSIFYSYTAFTGKSIIYLDILTFFISVLVSWILCFIILKSKNFGLWLNIVGIIGIAIILICYFTFTYFPPKSFLFKDPVSGEYGIIWVQKEKT